MTKSWVMLAILAIAGCGASAPTAPKSDWIELSTISPAGGTALTAGDHVTITATVVCTIVTKDSGRVGLLAYDQGNRSLSTSSSSPFQDLGKGATTVTLSDTILVPPVGSTVTVAIPIWVTGSNVTAAAKVVHYTVK